MSKSISTMTKSVLVAVLLCFIGICIAFYTTSRECSVQLAKTKNVLMGAYDWANFTSDIGNNAIPTLELASLSVYVSNNQVYNSNTNTASIFDKIFTTTDEFKIANTDVKFSIDSSEIYNSFLIKIVTLIVLIVIAALVTAQLFLIANYQYALFIKNSILSKRYEDLPFEDLSRELSRNDTQNEKEIADAKKKIEHLANAAAMDPMTNLYNRTTFNNAFEGLLNKVASREKSILGIFRASEINYINSERGYQMGDKYIHDLADIIKDSIKRFPGTNAYRISGTDIAILVPKGDEKVVNAINDTLKLQISEFQKTYDLTNVCYSGYTFFGPKEQKADIMSRADLALAKAQTSTGNGFAIQTENTDNYFQGEMHWLKTIKDIIEHRNITLYYQPIKSMNISIKPYVEIYAHFSTEEGEHLSTEIVLAAAQRHELLVKLEEMIIDSIISKYRLINQTDMRFGINLSSNALLSTSFLLWLERTLIRNSDIAEGLVFEIDEALLESSNMAAERLFGIIHRSGASTSISHFGKGLESFRLFRELKPNYIKIDPNICQSFDRDNTAQQFVRMLIEVSHRQGCVIVAEGIETIAQRQKVEALYVDAIQGYMIAKPQELEDKIELNWVTIKNSAEYSA